MLTLEGIRLIRGEFTLSADFQIAGGTRTAVIGPSGAGKSTLFDIIAGFAAPDAGRVLWQGRDLAGVNPGQRPMSLLFQDNNLFPHLSVYQNVALGISPALKLSEADVARVTKAIGRVGLSGLEARKPGALSGGQQGRVALARVLLSARPMVMLDEPFSALGPALKSEMLVLLDEVLSETGAAMLMVTHEPSDALAIAQETVLVTDGRAHPPTETKALFADPPPELRAYLGG